MKKIIPIMALALFFLCGVAIAKEGAKGKSKSSGEKAASKLLNAKGEVTAVSERSITLKGKEGQTEFDVSATTRVKLGKEEKSIADIKTGDRVSIAYKEEQGRKVARLIRLSPPKAGAAITKAPSKEKTPKAKEKKGKEK